MSISVSQFKPLLPFHPAGPKFVFYICDGFCFVSKFFCIILF